MSGLIDFTDCMYQLHVSSTVFFRLESLSLPQLLQVQQYTISDCFHPVL